MTDLERYLQNQKRLWSLTAANGVDEIAASGWISPKDKKVYSVEEMNECKENVFEKLRRPYFEREDCAVLEIGVGSGMILRKISDYVSSYDAVDISEEILGTCKKFLSGREKTSLRFFQMYAHEIDRLDQTYDIIILNSVMQYFADDEYVRDVLQKCKNRLRPGGVVFCGDILDIDKKDEIIAYTTPDDPKKNNFSKTKFYSRSFFKELSGFSRVDISDKIYTIPNEMSLFHFDALLYL